MKFGNDSAYKMMAIHNNDPRPTIYLTYLNTESVWRHSTNAGAAWEPFNDPIKPDQAILDALAEDARIENVDAAFEEIMRNNHYAMLISIPAVPGTKWVVTESIYWNFLEMLPPLNYPGGFAMSERSHGEVRSAYYQQGGHYWHEYVIL